MTQMSLDSFLTCECDLQDLLRAIGEREDWDAFHRAAVAYSAETGAVSAWYPDGYRDTRELALYDHEHSAGSRLHFLMGDGGWFNSTTRGFISIEGHHYCVVHIRIGNDLSMRVHPDEVDLFELHRRFFEILAEGEGMTLTSWGDNCHVRWDGTLWGVEA